tara:strand:+ start:296 stop:487 length:192 start_codon:yes stop_codon:yes gene_type:complete
MNVAVKNDKNNNDCKTILGKKSIGNKIPTNILLEKSGVGNRRKPINNPTIIDKYAFFSVKFLL